MNRQSRGYDRTNRKRLISNSDSESTTQNAVDDTE